MTAKAVTEKGLNQACQGKGIGPNGQACVSGGVARGGEGKGERKHREKNHSFPSFAHSFLTPREGGRGKNQRAS